MWTFVSLTSKIVSPLRTPNLFLLGRRTFLSESYRCREAWEKRLESPLLSKVNIPAMFMDLDHQFTHFGRASAIDVDVFLNALKEKKFISEVEDIVHKLRLSPDSSNTLPSTHQAVIRLLLDHGRKSTLLRILNDRLNYGIFPDHYTCNLLMDTFLKEKDYAAAARVGVSQMLQEDWDNLLTTRLSVYSCHMYLLNSEQPWLTEEEIVPPVEEPKEVIKVRVKFLRNPYYDDHFDIVDPKMLIGKTLAMFGPKVGASEALASSYRILGLTLYKKWEEVTNLALSLSAQRISVHKDAVTLARNFLKRTQTQGKVAEDVGTEPSVGKQEPDSKNADSPLENTEEDAVIKKVDDVLGALETAASTENMLSSMESLVREAVKQQENKDIAEQKELYVQWDKDRVAALQNYLAEVKKAENLKKLEKQKLDLIEEEREIFFFDREEELNLYIENRKKKLSQDEAEGRIIRAAKKTEEAEYVPPEVNTRRRNQK